MEPEKRGYFIEKRWKIASSTSVGLDEMWEHENTQFGERFGQQFESLPRRK